MFGLLDCDCYIGGIIILWIVKFGFCSIHFTATLARLKNVNHYIGNIVTLKIVISGFHIIMLQIIYQDLLAQDQLCQLISYCNVTFIK